MYRRKVCGGSNLPTQSRCYEVPHGTPALSYDAGVVLRSEQIGTGELVTIDHGGGLHSEYFHLRNRRVRVGQRVRAGQVVGDISYNPKSYQLSHLHFQIRKNGTRVDPAPYVAGAQVIDNPSWSFMTKLMLTGAIAWGAYNLLD
jgi:murein DD-endopeptidase MepM/ murein hydrolase activator NlpD